MSQARELAVAIKAKAHELGFDLAGVAPAVRPDGVDWLRRWLDQGFAGEMDYIPRREAAYEHPRGVLPPVRSVVMLAMNYRTEEPFTLLPLPRSAGEARVEGVSAINREAFGPLTLTLSPAAGEREPDKDQSATGHAAHGRVSRYAWGARDYHDVLRERLKSLADFLHDQRPGCRTRGVVDTAPLLERDFARLAGLGWFGKNTMLINKRLGSWFFLAGLLTDVELESDDAHHTSHCGTCTRCLEACPTDAFVEPYVLDARRCISYLTIELRNQPIPTEFRPLMGDWVFGCDVCQDVCPWNRKSPLSSEPAFAPRDKLNPADLESLLSLDEAGFETEFKGTPMYRTGRAALLRNAAIALGNNGDARSIPALARAMDDTEPLVRGAAAWALGEIGGPGARVALLERHSAKRDADVHAEITATAQRLAEPRVTQDLTQSANLARSVEPFFSLRLE